MGARKPLAELLVREKLINITQLELAKKEQKQHGGRLGSAIVKLGLLRDQQMTEFLSAQYGYPGVNLEEFEPDPDAIKVLPRNICEKHMVIPVSRSGNTLVIAFSDPSDVFMRDDLMVISRCKIEIVVATEISIAKAIEKYYPQASNGSIQSLVSDLENSEDALTFNDGNQAQALKNSIDGDQAPIIQFVNVMLGEAIKIKASDIHIEPYEKRLRIRYRIDGNLYEKIQPPPGVGAALSSRIKIMSKLDISERRKPQDGRLKVKTTQGIDVDFRVSVMPTIFGEKIVMRILDKANLKLDMTKLGFEEDDLKLFQSKLNEPQGMVLVTGPTGSGKTTTLYSALSSLNDPTLNISTAEDPIEFNLDGINQVQVQPEIGFTFATALRSFLRQDPDIILVGEIRDLETAEVAFKAASTGHLVLSTLHTNDAPSTISRLLDMGVAGFLITTTVSLVVAQRLAGKICLACKVEEQISPEALLSVGIPENEINDIKAFRGEGCSNCNGTGIKGRVALYELMTINDRTRQTIMKNGTTVDIKNAAIESGMRSLRQSAILKFKEGLIALEQVLYVTVKDSE
jgi:type IV pilus assembly protein PilB